MATCSNKQLGDKLHAWELGLLTEEERMEFEQHLLECEACANLAAQFQQAARALRSESRFKEIVAEETAALASERTTVAPKLSSRLWRRWLPGLVTVAVLALLILRPWNLEIKTTDEAIAQENQLAILTFANLSAADDPQKLGEIISSLLIADLSESRFIHVISSQHLNDIKRLVYNETDEIRPDELATKLARKSGARWILTGKIMQDAHETTITGELSDMVSGHVFGSQRVTGSNQESIFDLIDMLSREVRRDLQLPAEAGNELDRPVAEVTTNSPEAYRYYLEGLDLASRYYNAEAVESFRTALEYDSTFAMVYYHLALMVDRDLIDRAVEFSDNVNRKERLYIESLKAGLDGDTTRAITQLKEIIATYPYEKFAYYRLGIYEYNHGNLDGAVQFWDKAIGIDPLYKEAYNLSAYGLSKSGKHADAIRMINRYLEVAPDEPNPYDSRGDLYAAAGQAPEAIESFQKALERKPDFRPSRLKLGIMYLFNGEVDKAAEWYRSMTTDTSRSMRMMGRFYLPQVMQYQGQLRKVVEELNNGINDNLEDYKDTLQLGDPSSFHVLKALTFAELGSYDSAVSACDKAIRSSERLSETSHSQFEQALKAMYLARNNQFNSADSVLNILREGDSLSSNDQSAYWWGLGLVELSKGNPETAIAALEQCDTATLVYPLAWQYQLARALLEAGRTTEATALYEDMLSRLETDRLLFGIWDVQARYYVAQCFDNMGNKTKAISYYEEFLRLWRHADYSSPLIEEAKSSLARLRSDS